MPTPTVAVTLPFSADFAAPTKFRSSHADRAPIILPLTDRRGPCPSHAGAYEALLDEACDLARGLGCEVRRRLLGGAGIGGGHRWERGRLRIVLDLEATAADRLAVVADALRGESRLPWAEMSEELSAYLQPRRAA